METQAAGEGMAVSILRKVDDGKRKKRKEKKITAEIVATNVVASRSPNGDRLQRRPLVPIIIHCSLIEILVIITLGAENSKY